jgi:methyl-accepting chemotaxis protein
MSKLLSWRHATIRSTLFVGFGALVGCMILAGSIGWGAVRAGARSVSGEMESVLLTSRQTSDYANIISREIQAATSYLVDHDSAAQREFRRLGQQAHDLQRRFNASSHRSATEVAKIAAVDTRLADFENAYALAHRLSDLGRDAEAREQAYKARARVTGLLDDLSHFDEAKTSEVANVTNRLDTEARWRATLVLGAVSVAVLLALIIAIRTVRAIDRPLTMLTAHARRLSEGELGVRTESEGLAGEFETLAVAMNHAGQSLARIVDVAAHTADDVTSSAGDLATASREISDTASQVSQAVTQVSVGAEAQVRQIQQVTQSLNSIRDSADGVAAGAEEVQALAGSIEQQAKGKRSDLERSIGILYDVRTIVRQAADEVQALHATVGNINKFVGTVGRIADQTNLLSLNAAIEAARAGAAGRGFGVVADEIRKLADQARAAADEVVELTASVTSRVASTSTTMERGVGQVGEIERVSHEIDQTLAQILAAAERTRGAAESVAHTAEANVQAVHEATDSLSTVARTAEGHAATAMEVSASTEQQSAACEQMSAASEQLLSGSTRLRNMVGELRTA